MKETLEKIIKNNNYGLCLLDPPTGFGKTTAVVDIIKNFLCNPKTYPNVKRMFFVTNLKGNLPISDLYCQLSDGEKNQCFQAKATADYVIERFLDVTIADDEISNSKEYSTLKKEIQSYGYLKSQLSGKNENSVGLKTSIEILYNKIATITEPAFRQFIKARFLFNKSIGDKKKFIKNNGWFKYLYPICEIEKYKVIFLTTQKFISPMETFVRMPFYAYSDSITKDSVVFIDEYDSTKDVLLKQIVDDGLKNSVDIVSLFLDMHFALQHVVIPKKILSTTDYNKDKVESGQWHTSADHFNYWRDKFDKIYQKHNVQYLMKSVGFQYDRAFLFDDGKYFNIVQDNSKKFIYADLDKKEDILSLRGYDYNQELTPINVLIRDLEYCIDGFTKAIFYVSNNYLYFKNQSKTRDDTKYSLEESVYTVLDILNLSEEAKMYLFNKVIRGDYIFNKPTQDEAMRRGFNYTEIEDSNYHDMKSVVHGYSFPTTPEDIIVKLVEQSLVVGISATAKVPTCIGNYDNTYICKKIGDAYIKIDEDDSRRIESEFNKLLYSQRDKYQIHAQFIDELKGFSDKEKCAEMITQLFDNGMRQKWFDVLNNNKTKGYYFLLELKLTSIYKTICQNGIQSFIAFVNGFPQVKGDFDEDRLTKLFDDLCTQNRYNPLKFYIVKADNYDEKFDQIKKDLAASNQVFVLTTYKTIGTGKNIHYSIPQDSQDRVVRANSDATMTKDFEGIYLATPTNLLQTLHFDSKNKYNDLATYLFHQEYLYYNKHLTYNQLKHNIAFGFKYTFFGNAESHYTLNGDMNYHTLKIAIQAIGRICRSRNKNKDVYIFSDKEVVERLQKIPKKEYPRLLNDEFISLLGIPTDRYKIINKLQDYSKQSKRTYTTIRQAAFTVRQSIANVEEWKSIREFVLKNPTTDNPGKYVDFYFLFDEKYSGYSYRQNSYYDIVEMRMDTRYNLHQVSEQACELPEIFAIKYIKDMFMEKGYAQRFKHAHYIMTPSLFKQVYLGALGEVVGREILCRELGWDLQELDDISFYEYFDFKIGKIYFDFKHWDEFRTNNEKYVQKIEGKLNRIKGSKCFVINLLKRTDARPMINIGETVVQIPYLIDGENGVINQDAIEYISSLCDNRIC